MQGTEMIRIYGLVPESIVDGEGYRYVVFVQGCPHHCPGCHNPESHATEGGMEMPVWAVVGKIMGKKGIDGITLSGGEPFMQPLQCTRLAQAAHMRGLTVWCYTGYTLEELGTMAIGNTNVGKLLSQIDVLVDGRFIQEEKSMELLFKGSRNQRIIDMKKTRETGGVCLWEAPDWGMA